MAKKLVSFDDSTNRLPTAVETALSATFAPASGIAKTALVSGVQTSLDKADAALPQTAPTYGSYRGAVADGKAITITDPGGVHGKGIAFGNVAGFGFSGQGGGIFAPFVIYQRYGDVNGSNAPINETTQGGFVTTSYYGPTAHDSAESFSSAVQMKDTGTPYTQTEPVTGFEANVQIENGVTVSGTAHTGGPAYLLGQGSRVIMKSGASASWAMGAKMSATTETNDTGLGGGHLDKWQAFMDDLFNPVRGAPGASESFHGRNRITSEQSLYVYRSGFGGKAGIDVAGSGGGTTAFARLESPSPSTSRTVTVSATAGNYKVSGTGWTDADVGRVITVPGAGAAGVSLVAQITSYTSAAAWLDTAVATTVSSVSATVAEPDLRTLSLVAGTGQTQALMEARNPNDATGGWNFRLSVNGNVQTAGSSAGLYIFRNYTDAGPNIALQVTQASFNDYPYSSPTQGFKVNTGTAYGMQIAATASQKIAFHGATPTVQASRVGQLTDSSGGTASGTIAAISDTATKNAVASLAAKVNALESLMSAAAGGKGLTA